ncbi:MAG: hypothetical protein JWQ27_382 [Ferruginibacter sp.]|nr:hypothetical protein [Ferruginibacter sp.]
MIKYFFLLLTFLVLAVSKSTAQADLQFDKRFVESEDRWIAFQMNKDSSYPFGFIYIDAQAGLTFNYEGVFNITESGAFVPKKMDSANVKIRLQPNNVRVAFIPNDKFNELNIRAVPEWLRFYKADTASVERLYRWGFMYNGWNECAKALTFLERAEKLNPGYKGLAVELSFSYNCLQQYDKARSILEEAIKTNPNDAYVNKEYIYTLVNAKNIDQAIMQFEKSLKTLKDDQYHAENSFNILGYFYKQQDKANFNKWYDILKEQPGSSKMMKQYADDMKAGINK